MRESGSIVTLNGLVIAGGRSTRMGTDKALLPLDGGVPLLAVLLQRMAPHCGRIVVASGDGSRAQAYRTALAPYLPAALGERVSYAPDRRSPGGGPLAGLHAGLSALPSGYALVMGCDMPMLSASLLARMRAAAAAAEARVPVVHAAGQPFHALYHTELAPEAEALLERGEHRFMQLLRQQTAAVLVEPETADEHAAFTNLNTPEAYAAYMARATDRS